MKADCLQSVVVLPEWRAGYKQFLVKGFSGAALFNNLENIWNML